MADELKPPVAIRITRPYASEAEFLEREFDTLTHTSVVLLGAQPRPQGVVLRFEIVLKGGESILRGEGRVVGFKEKAHGGDSGGLSLRFTRLDARSKLLVDKAAALRDARARGGSIPPPRPSFPSLDSAPGLPNPPPSRPSTLPPPRASVPPPAPRASVPPPPPSRRAPPPLPSTARDSSPPPSSSPTAPMDSEDVETTQVDARFDLGPPPEAVPPSPAPPRAIRPTPARPPPLPQPVPVAPSPPPPVVAPAAPAAAMIIPAVFTAPVRARVAAAAFAGSFRDRGAKSIARPADRDALLTRLRARAESLPPARVREILAKSARPA